MPSFTCGRADFPLFPQAVSLPNFGKDSQWAGLPRKGKSVVGPWAGFKEGCLRSGEHRTGVKKWEASGSLSWFSHTATS